MATIKPPPSYHPSPVGFGAIGIIDADASTRITVTACASSMSQATLHVESREALIRSDITSFPVVVLALDGTDIGSEATFEHLKTVCPDVPVIVVVHPHHEPHVAHLRNRAYDWIHKPVSAETVQMALKRALERRDLKHQVERLTRDMSKRSVHPKQFRPLKDLEDEAIVKAIQLANGNVGNAAKLLGIGRATLYRRLAEKRLTHHVQQHSSVVPQRPSQLPSH